ncbi:hypothetical protein BC831DRAFT_459903 [Entophlyctis helioformis]|nr:hypothetical protein BC831DRAFT_459903 [Entophlyctis helioformis]
MTPLRGPSVSLTSGSSDVMLSNEPLSQWKHKPCARRLPVKLGSCGPARLVAGCVCAEPKIVGN